MRSATGNKVSSSNTYGGVSVGTTLSDAGLLDDGASLWFSVLVQTGSDIATNGDFGFVFGTDRIGSGNNIPVANSGQALGFTFKNNQLRASLLGSRHVDSQLHEQWQRRKPQHLVSGCRQVHLGGGIRYDRDLQGVPRI